MLSDLGSGVNQVLDCTLSSVELSIKGKRFRGKYIKSAMLKMLIIKMCNSLEPFVGSEWWKTPR